MTGAWSTGCARPSKLLDEVLETARRIADNAPISVRQAKHSIHYGLQMDLASGMMLEIEAYNRMVPTEDRREGIASFNEKRKPRFKGTVTRPDTEDGGCDGWRIAVTRLDRADPRPRRDGQARSPMMRCPTRCAHWRGNACSITSACALAGADDPLVAHPARRDGGDGRRGDRRA